MDYLPPLVKNLAVVLIGNVFHLGEVFLKGHILGKPRLQLLFCDCFVPIFLEVKVGSQDSGIFLLGIFGPLLQT